jgi:hypothetical protein
LGEQGRQLEALVSLNKALKIEPNNAELLAQRKELDSIQREKEAEGLLQHTIGNSDHSGDKNMMIEESKKSFNSISHHPELTAGSSKEEVFIYIDHIAGQLKSKSTSSATLKLLSLDYDQLHKEIISLVRVYFRQSSTLQELIEYIKYIWNNGSYQPTNNCNEEDRIPVAALLSQAIVLLANSIDDQRSSKVIFVESKLYTQCKAMLNDLNEQNIGLVAAVIKLLHVLTYDDHGCVKAKTMVTLDNQMLILLPTVIGNLSNNLYMNHDKFDTNIFQSYFQCIELGMRITQIITSDSQSKDMINNINMMQSASLVCSIGTALQVILHIYELQAKKNTNDKQKNNENVKNKIAADKIDDLVVTALGCLLSMSQKESMRICFSYPLPIGNEDKKDSKLSAISSLLNATKLFPHQLVNIISILMNASIAAASITSEGDRAIVVKEIYNHGGLDIALIASEQKSVGVADDIYTIQERARRVGLLSRLVVLPEVQNKLLTPDHYRLLVRNLNYLTSGVVCNEEEAEKWRQEEKSVYVRILASLSLPSSKELPLLLKIGREEQILASLMSIFPQPRTECHEVTPSSVIQMPHEPILPVLIGNTARCLIPYIDDVISARELFGSKKYLAVEKFICAMASCTDIRVRKNIAILLAKACRTVPEVRERISYFRGLQMMIELQNQL